MVTARSDHRNEQQQQIKLITMTARTSPLLLLLALFAIVPNQLLVQGDAFDDLWNQYMQQETEQQQQKQAQSAAYESTISRRERNLDHWDVPTAAAYLGLHPETLQALPQYYDSTTTTTSTTSGDAPSSSLVDEYIGHDAAILFYAQWDRNSHAVAPSWDAIASHLHAGTRSSKLVLAIFDCEKNARHMELCMAAGVKVYPTIMFVGSGEYHDTDVVTRSVLGRDKSAGPFGATTLRRTVKFQGNWQYGDQILDWVTIMRGLSSWHAMSESGPLRGLRNGIFGLLTGGKYRGGGRSGRGGGGKSKGEGGSLPVGIPPGFQTELRGMGGVSSTAAAASSSAAATGAGATTSSAADSKTIQELETKLNDTTKTKDLYEKAITHSNNLLEGLLFPSDGNNNDNEKVHDPFTILTKNEGWFSNATTLPPNAPNNEHPLILRSCALELSIDYCSRVTTRKTQIYLDELNAIPESDPFPTYEEIEQRLMDDVQSQEPYCSIFEDCIRSNFESEECRPEKCPYENKAACTYMETCLDPNIQDEYGIALGLIVEGEKVLEKDFGAVAASADGGAADEPAAGVGGWGIPVVN